MKGLGKWQTKKVRVDQGPQWSGSGAYVGHLFLFHSPRRVTLSYLAQVFIALRILTLAQSLHISSPPCLFFTLICAVSHIHSCVSLHVYRCPFTHISLSFGWSRCSSLFLHLSNLCHSCSVSNLCRTSRGSHMHAGVQGARPPDSQSIQNLTNATLSI